MKTKNYILLLFIFTLLQSCKAQQSNGTLLKVENHLIGELDYTHEALDLMQMQVNGEEISLGIINTDGTILFNLPEFDIKALYDSIPLQKYKFHSLFLMDSGCKDRDIFAETPFDGVYAQKYDPVYITKYGKNIAILYPVTNEKMLTNNQYVSKSLAVGSKYFWLYIDRAIVYNDECVKTSFKGNYDIEVAISTNIQFEKGWNFIEESLVEIQDYSRDDYHTTLPKKIQFTKSAPASKKVKWFLKQIMEDEKILAAKKSYEIAPITKEQFKKWLPEKAGDLTRTSYELDKTLDQSRSTKNNMYLVFEKGNQKMEIAVLDGAKNPDDLEMAKFSFAMDNEYKRDDKPTSDTTINDAATNGDEHHISKEDTEKKTSDIVSIFKDRIVLYASGENMTATQLWEAIKALDIASIIK
ncbi:hypothetical protein [Rasiella sp. SM2506]|uniref:hypothetical protein n=1 Tax=Rasiella sp. SM2506 TaxID=3423914 RepID=UPI003D790F2C